MSGPARNPISSYECHGTAARGRARAAGLLDLLGAAIVAMILVPQPFVRQTIMRGNVTAGGIVTFVAALLVAVLVAYWFYLAFALVSWGRTGAMYLLDLGLDAPTKPTTLEAAMWATGWALAALPALLGISAVCDPVSGLPARMSGMLTCTTSATGH